jgi:chorismate mutase
MNKNADKYFVVSSALLPSVLDNVARAKVLLQTGKAKDISAAAKMTGISRSTFYRYKDLVFDYATAQSSQRKAILTMTVQDVKGVLVSILSNVAQMNCNVLAINQTIPINKVTNVVLTLDITDASLPVAEMTGTLSALENVEKVELVAVE